MRVYRHFNDFKAPPSGCVVTVGNYDGVHLGHQAIIAHARQLADREQLPLIVITFEPAPVRFLRPDKAPRVLTPLPIKTRLLEQYAVDQLVIIEPTADFLALTPEQFIKTILVDRLGARHVVEGPTFNFGRRRAGSMVSLTDLAQQFGFQAHLVPACTVVLDDAPPVAVSSTLIRRYFAANNFDYVTQCLGHDHLFGGQVIAGHRRGRRLGFPTANIRLYSDHQLLPEDSVFAAFACFGDTFEQAWSRQHTYFAAVSIGRCETFVDGLWQIEAFLLDYQQPSPDSLYEKHLLFSLVERVRPQQRFASAGDLTEQIGHDCQTISRILQNRKPPSL